MCLNFVIFDWPGKNGDKSGGGGKSGNFDILCEGQPWLSFGSNPDGI